VLLFAALAGAGIAFDAAEVIVVSATVLPTLAAVNAFRRSRAKEDRERNAWRLLALSMGLMIPIYLAEYLGAFVFENVLIAAAYLVGALAIIVLPLPNAGPYQRMVASLDAVGIGVVAATAALWIALGSQLDGAGHTAWLVSDASIIAMVGYVALRRSQRRGVDWPLLSVIAGVGFYVTGVVVSSLSDIAYSIGHPADIAYVAGMMWFALAPVIRERTAIPPQHILKPVRWGHVLVPYVLIATLTVVLLAHQVAVWGQDPAGSVLQLGILAGMLLVLVRQLAMIAEQRNKIESEQAGVIATISHELRTPLTTIVGYVDLLEDWPSYEDDDKRQMIDAIRSESHVMARVVGDLVDLARNDIERRDLTRKRISLDDLLEVAVAVVPSLAEILVRTSITPGTHVDADRERLMQVLVNFLANAAQYGAGCIEVIAFERAQETWIEVHDDGPGVPEMYRVVMWERFERGPQRQSAIPGSGIGLSVARAIARAHGGDTDYRRSERLGGACFTVRIPSDWSIHGPDEVVAWPVAPMRAIGNPESTSPTDASAAAGS
jgi:signal transduction histidine kinase